MSVELAEIVRILDREEYAEPLTLAPPGSVPAEPLPEHWRPILESDDAETRRLTALSLWNREFLDLVPQFAHELRTGLADVRVGHQNGEAVLVYAFEHFDYGERVVTCWIGWDPATFGDAEPPIYACVPEPLRVFYRQVHAGFTASNWEFGPIRPKYLRTLSGFLHATEDDSDLWEGQDIPWTRLLVVAITGTVYYCVSPDLPPGAAVQVADGQPDDPEDFGWLLDKAMMYYFE
ncbi:hypothetical protein [Mycobacterium sp.]|uniref:hypothetical protein n=1 Tax=Mycobacterium sp. TaxID=1785 RepID=UPI002D9BB8BD|nr:hypothetical protein [Mycobacterium sp.]